MKKTMVLLLSLLLIFNLAACGNSGGQTEQPSAENLMESNDTMEENSNANDAESEEGLEATEETDISEPIEETDTSEGQGANVLVVYFSATNTTEGVAEHIANGLNAELYEIVPEEPYTDADLNYNDNNSRTTIEMNDPNARPVISGSVENMEQYEIVFIGYPIWWGEAPRIVSTFMESYDFSGKTIVPFCTSGGSGIGSSANNLEQLTSGATWMEGRRLNGGDSQETIMEWVNSLELNLGE